MQSRFSGPGCGTGTLRNWSGSSLCRIRGIPKKLVYTVAEVADLMGLSRQTVTRLFEHEKGVLILSRPVTMHKRRYRSIRIPRAVYERVVGRLTLR